MKPTPARFVLGVVGAVLLAVAAVRLAITLYQSARVSQPVSPTSGLIIGVSIDFFTLGVIAAGALLCVLGFRGRRA